MGSLVQQLLFSQAVQCGPRNDCANLPVVVEAASEEVRRSVVYRPSSPKAATVEPVPKYTLPLTTNGVMN